MKHRIESSIIIDAPLEIVWQAFMNFEEHARWNHFLRIPNGDKRVGERISVDFLSGDIVKMTMKPTVIKIQENKSFEWLGHLGIKGIFDGHHQFIFEDMGQGQTKFIQGENFSGLLIRFVMKSIIEPTAIDFGKNNEDFKTYIESKKSIK